MGAVTDSYVNTKVAGDAAIGASMGITVTATDTNLDRMVTCSLPVADEELFAIFVSSGVIIVASILDAEAASGHTMMVGSTSTDFSSSTDFSIVVTDASEASMGAITDDVRPGVQGQCA
ncbi:MAG: cadherin repeat domain-containing protein [Pseudomonadota bacterium]